MKSIPASILLSVLLSGGVEAAEKSRFEKFYRFENEQLRIRLAPRTPEQIAAFYEARKFPANMIKRLKQECFITVGIQNKSKHITWLELDNWTFTNSSGVIKRYHRKEWPGVWQSLDVPMASQSTFRWTLLPEMLDFRPGEREGGNIILKRTGDPFTVSARFKTGVNRDKSHIDIKIENVKCAGGNQ